MRTDDVTLYSPGWWLDMSEERHFLLAAVVSTAVVFPWTKVAIMPINNLLMDGEAPKKTGQDLLKFSSKVGF